MLYYSIISNTDYKITNTNYIITISNYIIIGKDLEIIWYITIFVYKERKFFPIANKTIYIQELWQSISNKK